MIFNDSLGYFGEEISPFSFTVLCTSALHGLSSEPIFSCSEYVLQRSEVVAVVGVEVGWFH